MTLRRVVDAIGAHVDEVIVVDDGSGPEGRAACEALASEGLAHVVHRAKNGGKGAAVKTGFEAASERGFTHALQVDADGQHDLERVPAMLAQAEAEPEALLLGCPVYDESVNRGRLAARKITNFWVNLEVGRGVIEDAMVGFRVYPLEQALAVNVPGNRMDFDVEVAVRMAWTGMKIINMPVGVRYLTAEEGGFSSFQPLRDNLRFGWLHTKLCTLGMFLWALRLLRLLPRAQ